MQNFKEGSTKQGDLPMKNTNQPTRLIPLVDWPKVHAWPPLGGLRHLVFYAEKTGFGKVIKKCAGRVLIDEAAFFAWVEENNANK